MGRASRSWGHKIRLLSDREIDFADRWGRRCTAGKCTGPTTHLASYEYVTGRAGRVSSREQQVCASHGQRFAATYGIDVTPAPTPEPARRGIVAALTTAGSGEAETARVERAPLGRYWYVSLHGGGFLTSGSYLLDVDPDVPVHQVLPHAERQLARSRRLVPIEPWRTDGSGAKAMVDRAERLPEWANVRWSVTVYEERGTWCARFVLDERFAQEVIRLGNTGMNLDRAIRTVVAELDGWRFGTWSCSSDTATTQAARPGGDRHRQS